VPAQESGGRSREHVGALSAEEVIERLQELAEMGPIGPGVSLEWAVSAYFLGDVNALACLSLFSDR
jgi:hypothetical protein